MLDKQSKQIQDVLKRLERNKKDLLKQSKKIEKIFDEFDKRLLTLIQ